MSAAWLVNIHIIKAHPWPLQQHAVHCLPFARLQLMKLIFTAGLSTVENMNSEPNRKRAIFKQCKLQDQAVARGTRTQVLPGDDVILDSSTGGSKPIFPRQTDNLTFAPRAGFDYKAIAFYCCKTRALREKPNIHPEISTRELKQTKNKIQIWRSGHC